MSDPRSADEILDALIDLDPALRAARLAELCGHDRTLLDEVSSLLAAFEASGGFLETPIEFEGLHPHDREHAAREVIGRDFGEYHVLGHLGSGGSGDVYLAERTIEGYRQRVALKIIRTALLAPEALHRFRNECRVLARVEHPAIERLIEGAVTPEGVPYLVLEYVDGKPIDRHADEAGLGVEARLRLLVQACEAVAHLHRHSVLHRDIKPENLLVGADGRVKLIDMGIARVMDIADDDATMTVWERMTPSYASPEQLRGEVLTTASDVYSLGVLGYRLLTNALPYRGRKRHELEREMTTTTVRRPSDAAREFDPTLARRLSGDLDTILLKALHQDAERRYPSAEALRDDLVRHLEARPVLARGDSVAYLAGTFVRRHTAVVAAAALSVLVLVASTVTGFVLFGRAETARHQAERERATAEQTVRFLDGILVSADPLGKGASPDLTVREVLEAASRRIDSELADQPLVAARLGQTIGQAFVNLGAYAEGERHLARAAELHAVHGEPNSPDALLNAQRRVELHWKSGEFDVADSLLAPLLRGELPTPVLRANVGLVASRLRAGQADFEAAEEHVRAVLDDAVQFVDPGTGLPAQIYNQLGVVLYQTGRFAEADSMMLTAIDLALRDLGPDHMLTGEFIGNRGSVLAELGRLDEAIAASKQAQEIQAPVLGADHVDLGVGETNLGNLYTSKGDARTALQHYTRAREIFEAKLGTDHNYWAFATNGMAVCLHNLGRLAEAEQSWTQALAVMEAQFGLEHPQAALVRLNLARVRHQLGDRETPHALAEISRAALAKAFPDGSNLTSRAEVALATFALEEGRPTDALPHARRAEELCAGLVVGHPDRNIAAGLRIRIRAAMGERVEALAELDALVDELTNAGVDAAVIAKARGLREEIEGEP